MSAKRIRHYFVTGLILLLSACRTVNQEPSNLSSDQSEETYEGDIVSRLILDDATDEEIARIYLIMSKLNRAWPIGTLKEALNTGPLEALVFEKNNTIMGFILLETTDKLIVMHDAALAQDVPYDEVESYVKAMDDRLIKHRASRETTKKFPYLARIKGAFTRHVDLYKKLLFSDASTSAANIPSPSQDQAGNTDYEGMHYYIRDGGPDIEKVIMDFVSNTQLYTRALPLRQIQTLSPASEAKVREGLIDLKEHVQAFPDLNTEVPLKEIETEILNVLLTNESIVVLGEKGDGKSYNSIRVVYRLARGLYDNQLYSFIESANGIPQKVELKFDLWELQPSKFLSRTSFRGQLEERIAELITKSYDSLQVIYSDELHILATLSGNSNLTQQLKERLSVNVVRPDGKTQGIKLAGNTTIREWYDAFGHDEAWMDRFVEYFIQPPNDKTIITALKNKIEFFARTGGSLSEDAQQLAEYAYYMALIGKPNGGRFREPTLFMDAVLASVRSTRKLDRKAIFKRAAYRYGLPENIHLRDQAANLQQNFDSIFATEFGNTSENLKDQIEESIAASFEEDPDNTLTHATLITGNTQADLLGTSQKINKILNRKTVVVNAANVNRSVPEMLLYLEEQIRNTDVGGSFVTFIFDNFESATPQMQQALFDMFNEGQIINKLQAPGGRAQTREFKIPNVLGHMLYNESKEKPSLGGPTDWPAEFTNVIRVQDLSAEDLATRVRAKVDQLLAEDPYFKGSTIPKGAIAYFVDEFLKDKQNEGKNFRAVESRIGTRLRIFAVRNNFVVPDTCEDALDVVKNQNSNQ